MQDRKNILVFIEHFYSAHKSGGPLLSISNLLNLGYSKSNFRVITQADKENSDKSGKWLQHEQITVFLSLFYRDYIKGIEGSNSSTAYLNSLFNFKYSILVVLLNKLRIVKFSSILIAPRGELSEGALSLKRVKKKLFLLFVKSIGFYKSIIWHASTELESKEIKKVFGARAEVRIALDIPKVDLKRDETKKYLKEKNFLRIIFISRIDRKKNLRFVLETLKQIKCKYTFDIYGPITDPVYWEECKKELNTINCVYKGLVKHERIDEVFPKYDVFFFPTLGENFGHVIFESLALGVPVLCSDTTPWNKLEENQAGWNVKLKDENRYIELIENLATLNEEEFNKFRIGAERYAFKVVNDPKNIVDNLNLFDGL